MRLLDDAVVLELLPSQVVRHCAGNRIDFVADAPESRTGKVEGQFVYNIDCSFDGTAVHPTYTPVLNARSIANLVGMGASNWEQPSTGLRMFVTMCKEPDPEHACEMYEPREEYDLYQELKQAFPRDTDFGGKDPRRVWGEHTGN